MLTDRCAATVLASIATTIVLADPCTATERALMALSQMWAVVRREAALLAIITAKIVMADLRAATGLAVVATTTVLADACTATVLAEVASTIVRATAWLLLHCHSRLGLVLGEHLGILRRRAHW